MSALFYRLCLLGVQNLMFIMRVCGHDTAPFGTQYSGFLDGMQYVKGWYAFHKNPVISYADINFFF